MSVEHVTPFDLLLQQIDNTTSNADVARVLEHFMADLELLIPGAAAWPVDELVRYLTAHPHEEQQLTRLTLTSRQHPRASSTRRELMNEQNKQPDLAALELAWYDNDYEWLDTQAQQAGMTLTEFCGRLLDELYVSNRPYPPVNRPPKGNTTLKQFVKNATEVFGNEVTLAARERAYDAVAGTPNGVGWTLAFQRAYIIELQRLLQPQ